MEILTGELAGSMSGLQAAAKGGLMALSLTLLPIEWTRDAVIAEAIATAFMACRRISGS